MDLASFLPSSGVVIVAGKGGVGKTTTSAVLALLAAQQGWSTLLVDIQEGGGLGALFGRAPLVYEETTLVPSSGRLAEVRGRAVTPDEALFEYLEDHGLRRLSRRLVASGAIDVVSTAVPGIKDILVLGKVKQLEHSGRYDVVIVDAPAAGHAITFLLSARGLLDAVRAGPIHTQAREVVDLLTDPARCSVILVTLAEETPVNEVVETAFHLEDRVGVRLGPVVVNGLYQVIEGLSDDPQQMVMAAQHAGIGLSYVDAETLAAAARFRLDRQRLQALQLERLSEALPLAQVHLPFLFRADFGLTEVEILAGAVRDAGMSR